MSTTKVQIARLEDSLTKLLENYKLVQSRVQELERELRSKDEELSDQKNRLKDLEESNKRIKLAERISQSDMDRKELKKEIDLYLKEIDRCIALISE